ncbi:MAG: tRNA (N6-threonylcarbamoyladenosine(37)-N6)-methyltransferase TrmO [Hyphomicrobiaceae bacterium]|nr:tRNA (N6-threonylcarbamoyladenosine(37)-N6)-methyltransferase TrmO [Hyphomicrobiaceae bacterium]MCC0008389.1 tRNA (N6-threonylcarbamoyladenosine(37)-N6)-methyltransferase TrmO [Hyphomicrobiaceae bacterium]
MPEFKPPRPGEVAIALPGTPDARLIFIGRIRTAYPTPADCPKNTLERTEPAVIEVDPPFDAGLRGIEGFSHLIALYWLDRSRRDLVVQHPSHRIEPTGVFALRSPVRPNPIGLAVVEVLAREGGRITIRAIDCADGTPLLDLKPYLASSDSVPHASRP